jgi:hypothetical protein
MTTITDQAIINAIQAAYNSGNWQAAYQLVFDAITTVTTFQDSFSQNPNPDVDPAVWIWVAGAKKVNSSTVRDHEKRFGAGALCNHSSTLNVSPRARTTSLLSLRRLCFLCRADMGIMISCAPRGSVVGVDVFEKFFAFFDNTRFAA